VWSDPDLRRRGIFVTVNDVDRGEVTIPGWPIQMSESKVPVRTAPRLGEHNKDILVVVDNTFMTAFFQKPLALGADVVVYSLTKYVNGHTDVIMGAAMTNSEKLDKHIHYMQKFIGAVPSPFDVYLVSRALKTLHIRMARHMENAVAIAHYLEQHPRVEKVNYPELASHPQHAIHKKQTTGMSGMLSFYIRDAGNEDTLNFMRALKVFTTATSLGGVDSLAEMSKYTMHNLPDALHPAGLTDNLVRLSVGIEEKEDLIADLSQALEAMDEAAKQRV